MFKLTIHDRKGTPLNEGDTVRIYSNGWRSDYLMFAEVKFLPEEQAISPFSTFSFHSFEKVDQLPEGAKLSESETRYKTWYVDGDGEIGEDEYKNYLMEWRTCETLLEEKIFRIEKLN